MLHYLIPVVLSFCNARAPADNSVWAQWHRLSLPVETAMAMPPRRRSLFRGIWQIGGPADDPRNQQYSLENRAF